MAKGDVDLSCVQCGYNLRGLTADGKCPECSTPVSDSLDRARLGFADRGWLGTVHSGLRLMLYATVGVLVLLVGVELVSMAAWAMSQSQSGGATWRGIFSRMVVTPAIFGVAAGPTALFWGIWNATAPEPSVAAGVKRSRLRVAARVTAAVAIPVGLGVAALEFVGAAAAVLFAWLAVAVFALGLVCFLGYLRSLTCRIPDRKLAAVSTCPRSIP